MTTDRDFLIVAMDKFILATHDSGYKDTPSAVSELVDNSLQAGSTEIAVTLALDERDGVHPIVRRLRCAFFSAAAQSAPRDSFRPPADGAA